METTDDFVEVELPDNEYFHEGVVGLAMDIVADCKMVVETVNGINTEMEPDTTDTTDAIKETFVQAIKRVPQSAARLVDMTHQFIRENAAFYLDDQQYLDLFKILQANTRAVKESVLLLLRLATVSVWTTKSAATTAKTQGQLETYCKNVALAIKKVIGAADQLRLMQEQEEEGLIEEEAEELARLVMDKTVQLARAGSAAVKELVEATYQLQDREHFVVAVKSTLQAITPFVDFGAALSLREADALRKAAFDFLTAAKAAFQAQNDDASFARLESAKDGLAEAMRATVLAARAINTEDIVRNQLAPADAFDDGADEAEEEEAEEPYLAPAPVRPAAAAASSPLLIGARQSAPPGALAHRLAPPASNGATGFRKQTRTQNSLPPVMNTTMQLQQRQQQTLHSEGEDGPGNADKMRHTTMTGQHINQIQLLRQHLQLPPSEAQAVVKRGTVRRKVAARKSEEPLAVDMARYEAEIKKIEFLQRFMRKWLRISKFRNTALNFLTAPESERLRKRNMAFREIVCTERGYVNNLEELEKRIISPLKASSHSFISEKEVGVLFSNLESITCLNIQILELMEERIEQWPCEGRFADIFIEKAPVLRLYTDYLNNYDRQMTVLTELEKKPAFIQFIKACKAKMNLGNYLILPVQRLPRYEILLEGLKRYTSEEHVDYPNIIAALDKVKELNSHVDKKKKDEDNRRAIQEIQKAVSGAPTLFVAHRQFIRGGLVDVLAGKKKEKFYVYLFTDILLLTKAKVKTVVPGAARPKSKLKDLIYLKDGPFSASAMSLDGSSALRLVGGRKEFLFCFSSDTERDGWQRDIDTVLREEGWKKIFY